MIPSLSFDMARRGALSCHLPILALAMNLGLLILPAQALATILTLQSTTSTQNSGLYEYLLPLYEAETGDEVRVVAVGTGQALTNGQRCDGDILIIHSLEDEQEFVKDGYGLYRKNIMYNDFVLIGPQGDPASLSQANTAADAFLRLYDNKSLFVSRGDKSGTHKSELRQWAQISINPLPDSGQWYLETGTGMGATLNAAIELGAYVYADRATWLKFGNKQDHKILFENDTALFNQYGVIPIAPSHCPSTKIDAALRLADWLVSPAGQKAIAAYRLNGKPLFIPNAE